MQIRTKIDGKMQKELLMWQIVCSWILLGIGTAGLIVYIGVCVGLDLKENYPLLISCSIVFAVGLVFVVTYNKIVKNAEVINKTNIYTFSQEFMQIETEYHGEIQESSKLYYSDILKIKETKNYIFVYPDSTKAFPIEKKNVSDIDSLRRLLFSGQKKK